MADKKTKNNSQKSQIELAREAGNTWIHDGKEYELFVVNKQGGVAVPILDENQQTIAIASAIFAWDKKDDLLDVFDWELREETVDEITRRKSKDATTLNAGIFHKTVRTGEWTEIIDGERQEPQFLSRDEMLKAEDEIQSSLFRNWTDSLTITRFVPKGVSKLDLFFKKTADNVFFLATIGDKQKPRHAFLLEFTKPSLEIRREMRLKRTPESKNENGIDVRLFPNTAHFRLQQCKKHFVGVQGVSLLEPGKPFDVTSDEDKKAFLDNFNPIWQVYFSDALFAVFDTTGK